MPLLLYEGFAIMFSDITCKSGAATRPVDETTVSLQYMKTTIFRYHLVI